MERTPEEIKKSLECSAAQVDGRCEEYAACACCPLFVEGVGMEDIAAYIRQLERINTDFAERTARLEVQLREAALKVPEWCDPEVELPVEDGNVLVIVSGHPTVNVTMDHAYMLAAYIGDGGWIVEGWETWEKPTVHRWMPLPEPPEEGNA